MTQNFRCLFLLPLLSGLLLAAEPFHLRLPELSRCWFPGGAVVRVPRSKATRLEVRLDQEAASQTPMESLTLTLNEQYPKFVRAANSEGYLLTVTTREPLGLLVNEEYLIEATAVGEHSYKGEWTVTQWEKGYIQSTLTGAQNSSISIKIDNPHDGVVLADESSPLVRISGEIPGNCDCRLTIEGQEVRRLATEPGFHFCAQVSIEPGAREMVVSATDETGAMTVLSLPVVWKSGQ